MKSDTSVKNNPQFQEYFRISDRIPQKFNFWKNVKGSYMTPVKYIIEKIKNLGKENNSTHFFNSHKKSKSTKI